jgi:para-aminobenzoate synthetase component 1
MALAQAHSAPYSAYMGLPDNKAVLSFSPESFLHMDANGHIHTRPIKGTRPRHADAAADAQAASELQHSEKDRAENLMIVDLLRNDLGKCCEPGSIAASKLFELESHPNVHHLASTVEGQCRAGVTPLQVLQACFPGGSITGAPKQRAMQIISELETVRRSVYCGAIGYISDDGQMNTSIAIRTLVADGTQMHCWGGSGIVADSDCDAEYQECADKVAVFMQALEKAGVNA